jgi:hypothetical protein
MVGRSPVDEEFLAALLCVADELDASYLRGAWLPSEQISIRCKSQIHLPSIKPEAWAITLSARPKTRLEFDMIKEIRDNMARVLGVMYSRLQRRGLHYQNIKLRPSKFEPIRKSLPGAASREVATVDLSSLIGQSGVTDVNSDKWLGDDLPDNAVFRVELLSSPIRLNRQWEEGRVRNTVDIDRRGTVYGLYTNEAKNLACELTCNLQGRYEWAKLVDQALHNFLLGEDRPFYLNSSRFASCFQDEHSYDIVELSTQHLPLRWASGGVLPVVTIGNKLYSAFFFRDIPPFGWNIPLGASGSFYEMNNPTMILWREFLEEFLVLSKSPYQCGNPNSNERHDSALSFRLPQINSDHVDIRYWAAKALRFALEHCRLRDEYDKIQIERDDDDPIEFTQISTDTVITIRTSKVDPMHFKDVLVAINPLELGIEVVGVVQCKIRETDYLLDGEIITTDNQLVRMPIALISHEYLRRNSVPGSSFRKLIYDPERKAQASILGEEFHEDEIFVFWWDVDRRRFILRNEEFSSGEGNNCEVKRYKRWEIENRLGEHFPPHSKLDEHDVAWLGRDAYRYFTPTSAKIASYYLNSNI